MAENAPLVVVANRLPVRGVERNGQWEWSLSSGGLVVGPGSRARRLRRRVDRLGRAISGGEEHGAASSRGHCAAARCRSARRSTRGSTSGSPTRRCGRCTTTRSAPPDVRPCLVARVRPVNERYAAAAADAAAPGATVWVHDYQLQLVPAMLRKLRPDVGSGSSCTSRSRPASCSCSFRGGEEILEGLLGADLVGFQVPGGASNFARLARRVAGATGTDAMVQFEGRHVRVGAFPISVDAAELEAGRRSRRAGQRADAAPRRARRPAGRAARRRSPRLHEGHRSAPAGVSASCFADGTLDASRHVVVQVAVPSREDDAHYQREREDLEQLVGEINGEHASVGRPPIHYLHQSVLARRARGAVPARPT